MANFIIILICIFMLALGGDRGAGLIVLFIIIIILIIKFPVVLGILAVFFCLYILVAIFNSIDLNSKPTKGKNKKEKNETQYPQIIESNLKNKKEQELEEMEQELKRMEQVYKNKKK